MHCFGPYQFDSRTGLSRAGKTIRVPPKERALLELLLRKNGAIVGHRDIEKAVWSGRQVSYESVARCVYSLRKVLDDADRALIATVPKHGYRLGVAIKPAAAEAHTSMQEKVAHAHPRAYAEFLEGLREANLGRPENMQRAVSHFAVSAQIDPNFAAAHSAIADSRIYQVLRGQLLPDEALRSGLAACEQALAIDARLASAHAARGWFVGSMERNTHLGLEQIELALELDASYARGYTYLAFVQRSAGLLDASVVSMRRAVDLDPYSLMSRHAMSWALFCAGRADEGLEVERKLRRQYPLDEVAHGYTAIMAAWLGAYDEAIDAADDAIALSNNNPAFMTTLSYARARRGETSEARALAAALQGEGIPRAPLPHLAMTYAALNDSDAAFTLLARARDEGCPWFLGARHDPRLDGLGLDPRFVELFEG